MALIMLLDAIADFLTETFKDTTMLRVKPEDDDESAEVAGITVFQQRIPNPEDPTMHIPYILLQTLEGADERDDDGQEHSTAMVRMIITIYEPDPVEGSKAISNLVSRMREELQKTGHVGGRNGLQYKLLRPFKYEFDVDNTLPYHLAEIISLWSVPSVRPPNYDFEGWNDWN